MIFHDIAVIAAGIAMGFWLDRLLGPGRLAWVTLGILALGGLVLVGQEWAGMALGCLLGARGQGAQRSVRRHSAGTTPPPRQAGRRLRPSPAARRRPCPDRRTACSD